MYDEVAYVQEKNDAVAYAQNKNDASCGCTMHQWMYKRIMIKNKLQKGAVNLNYVPIEEHVADVLTKPLFRVKFEYFRDKIGVVRKGLPRKRESRRWQRVVVVWYLILGWGKARQDCWNESVIKSVEAY